MAPSGKKRWPRIVGAAVALIGGAVALAAANFDRVMPALLRLDPEMRAAPHYTDEESAGPDFSVQGEYANPSAPHAVQVVARGDGRFLARVFTGGLPGAGWDGAPTRTLDGQRTGDTTTFRGNTAAMISGGALHLKTPDGHGYRLERVHRESPTLGAPPPPGAVVLFADGVNEFLGDVDAKGRLAEGATSRDAFGDFALHIEFRTPFEPGLVSQKRGNSGVYLQKRYEVQILDSFGLTGEHDECGGLYKQKQPDVNMALPPLAWQTYDVDFRAARFDDANERVAPAQVTVRHNGVLIHDAVELSGPTGLGAPETAEPGPLFLQDHGNPVRFRNIWLVPGPD